MPRVTLLDPPVWDYTAAPVELTLTAGGLRGRGVEVRVWDGNAALARDLLGDLPGYAALQQFATYTDVPAHLAASASLRAGCEAMSRRFGARYTLRQLSFPGLDLSHAPSARRLGLDPSRNPALPTLTAAAARVAAGAPDAVGLALAHPDQIPHALALARLLREAGYQGTVALYGSLEDALAVSDLAPDLPGEPRHALFDDIDLAISGDADAALAALAAGADPRGVSGVVGPGFAVPPGPPSPLDAHPGPDFTVLAPTGYLAPAPVVDLRLGRGCPWGRCAFCAIQAHQPGYRASPAARVAAAMTDAHAALGSVFFRVRDDLLTPRQLRELAQATAALPIRPRWSARARLEPTLTAETLRLAAEGGLEELWVGLESASARVRDRMDKGVTDDVARAALTAAAAAGVRVRLLCMVGFPGESLEEARSTLDFARSWAPALASVAVTPFLLSRASPMASRLTEWGLRATPDPLPRHERLRWTLPYAADDALDAAALQGLVQDAYSTVLPLLPRVLGPDLHHDWMSASLHRHPLPSLGTLLPTR